MNRLLFLLLCLSGIYGQAPGQSAPAIYTLNQCIAYGLQHQPSLQVRQLAWQRTQEEQKAAVSRLLPQIAVNGSFDYYWAIPVQVFPAEVLGGEKGNYVPLRIGTPYNAGAGIEAQWDILKAASWQEVRTAAIRQQLAQTEMQSEKAVLVKNITKAYYTVLLQQKQQAFDQQNLLNYDTLRTIARLRFEKGAVSQIDVNRVQSSYLLAQQDAQRSANAYTSSLLQLKLWMGLSPDIEITVQDQSIDILSLRTVAFSVTNHPDYALYQQRQHLYTSELRMRKTERLPTLSIYSSYYKRAYRTSADFFSGGSQTWFGTGLVGVQLRIPVFNGWQLQRHIQASRFALEQAQAEEKTFHLKTAVAYAEQSDALRTHAANLQLMQESLKLAQENQQIATYRFAKGVSTTDILKTIQRETLEAQKSYLNTLSDYYMSRVELSYLNGEYTK